MSEREYRINIDPRILELLGPSLYTNIYYVLAELIANAYDANAKNVYIIRADDAVIVEDDGTGMSYREGDVEHYLHVAVETRTDEDSSYTYDHKRKKMGRKGIGKLAALSVSENVWVMSQKNNEKSGFILSRQVGPDNKLIPIEEDKISFRMIGNNNGTSIVMTNPQYRLHKTLTAIKNNLLKIFPIVSKDFRIHIIDGDQTLVVDSFDEDMVKSLGALITLGDEYGYLSNHFKPGQGIDSSKVLDVASPYVTEIMLKNKAGISRSYTLEIKGWIGAYRTTRDRKIDPTDFPDNFISLFSNGKLGEYNILPVVGKNRLPEVYVVGQLHIDLFEATDLPDMALSNRQGYKSDDIRYEKVISYVRDELLPKIIELRETWASYNNKAKDDLKRKKQQDDEAELREKVDNYKSTTASSVVERLTESGSQVPAGLLKIIQDELNRTMPLIGIKQKVDVQKKRLLISHSSSDKVLCDVVYKMLSFNGVTDEDILYTSSDKTECRIPEGTDVLEYLRDFFVNSYSDQKIFVIYVTSEDMAKSWFAVTEVGAGWITRSDHKIFNVKGHSPRRPLDTSTEWQESDVSGNGITLTTKEFDKFIVKIIDVAIRLGYKPESKADNVTELTRYVITKG